MTTDRTRTATFDDGSQILVTDWTDADGNDHTTAATRPHRDATWGPPRELIDQGYDPVPTEQTRQRTRRPAEQRPTSTSHRVHLGIDPDRPHRTACGLPDGVTSDKADDIDCLTCRSSHAWWNAENEGRIQ